MGFDTHEVKALAVELGAQPVRVAAEVSRSLFKGSMNIKRAWAKDLGSRPHFSPVAAAVDFEIEMNGDAQEAEIGPRKEGAGPLANVAIFGVPRGGGGMAKDPQEFLDDEEPKFIGALREILGGLH